MAASGGATHGQLCSALEATSDLLVRIVHPERSGGPVGRVQRPAVSAKRVLPGPIAYDMRSHVMMSKMSRMAMGYRSIG